MSPAKKAVKKTFSDNDFLISSDLKLHRCPRCQALIAKGLVSGFPVSVDVKPIESVLDELNHIFLGGRTFDVHGEFSAVRLELRLIYTLENANHRPTGLVIGSHRCQEVGL